MDLESLPSTVTVVKEAPYVKLQAQDPDSFLAVLSPISGLTGRRPFKVTLFRGQSDSSWRLLPKSRRKAAWPPPGLIPKRQDIWFNRLIWEIQSLLSFCRNADGQGLPIPHLSQVRDELVSLMETFSVDEFEAFETWPPPIAIPALALAQHYGLPTCLLDFTWNPYVAAYFAVRGFVEAPTQRGRSLCVWIIDDPILANNHESANKTVRLLVPPASDNRTLQAQEGVFLWTPLEQATADEQRIYSEAKHAIYSEGNQAMENLLTNRDHQRDTVVQLCLEQRFAQLLLNRLVRLGYDSVRMFPSYDGAAKAVVDHTWADIVQPISH